MRKHIHIHMVKVISLSETAYKELKAEKKSEESFSNVVIRLLETKKKKNILDFVGKWTEQKKN